MASHEAPLKRCVFLLGAQRVAPAHGECHPGELLRASETVGRMLTNQFYARYADIREGIDFILDPIRATIRPDLDEHIDGLRSVLQRPAVAPPSILPA